MDAVAFRTSSLTVTYTLFTFTRACVGAELERHKQGLLRRTHASYAYDAYACSTGASRADSEWLSDFGHT